jgi:hypothetical protein
MYISRIHSSCHRGVMSQFSSRGVMSHVTGLLSSLSLSLFFSLSLFSLLPQLKCISLFSFDSAQHVADDAHFSLGVSSSTELFVLSPYVRILSFLLSLSLLLPLSLSLSSSLSPPSLSFLSLSYSLSLSPPPSF